MAGPVAQVGLPIRSTAVPDTLFSINEVLAAVSRLIEADIVEDEELRLRSPVACRRNAGLDQVPLRLLGYVAWIPRIPLTGHRILHVADQAERWNRTDRIDNRSSRIGDQKHVTLVNLLETPDARAIKAQPLFEDVNLELRDRRGEVLPGPRQIDELVVYELHPSLARECDNLLGSRQRLRTGHVDGHQGSFLLIRLRAAHRARANALLPILYGLTRTRVYVRRDQKPKASFVLYAQMRDHSGDGVGELPVGISRAQVICTRGRPSLSPMRATLSRTTRSISCDLAGTSTSGSTRTSISISTSLPRAVTVG